LFQSNSKFRSNLKIAFVLVLFTMVTVTPSPSANAKEPRAGGTLIYPAPYGGAVGTLDPANTTRTQDYIIINAINEGLVQIDPETLKTEPSLATDWEVSSDGLKYTFHLKEGVTFHNGEKFTAQDVRYTFERIMDPKEASLATNLLTPVEGAQAFNEGEADSITGIEVLGQYELRITLNQRASYFLYNLASPNLAIVSRQAVEKWGDEYGSHPVGTGPFYFEQWRRGSFIEVKRFDNYHVEGLPYLDKIRFRVMPETSARVASFRGEDLDFDIVGVSMYQTYKNSPKYKDLLHEGAELYTREITFNLSVEKLRDKRVRQAFNYAIDKKLVVQKLLSGKAYPATGWFPNSLSAFNPDLKGYEYEPGKAKELMEEAGYGEDNRLKLKIIGTNNSAWGIPVVEAITPFLEKVGFDIEPVLVDGSTLASKQSEGDFEAAIWSLGGTVSPVRYIKNYFYSEVPRSAGRFSAYESAEFDKYLETAMEATAVEERIEALQKAEKVIVEDAPVWFFNYNKAVGIRQPWVHGTVSNAREMAFQPFAQIWIDEGSPRS